MIVVDITCVSKQDIEVNTKVMVEKRVGKIKAESEGLHLP
jgi:hypothetical protein